MADACEEQRHNTTQLQHLQSALLFLSISGKGKNLQHGNRRNIATLREGDSMLPLATASGAHMP